MGPLLPTTLAAGSQAASLGFHAVATGPWIMPFEWLALGMASVIAQATLITHSGSVLVSSPE